MSVAEPDANTVAVPEDKRASEPSCDREREVAA